jgi:hypothetical protein
MPYGLLYIVVGSGLEQEAPETHAQGSVGKLVRASSDWPTACTKGKLIWCMSVW